VKALQFNRTGESRYSLHDVALSLASCERHSRYPTLRGDFTHPSRKDTTKMVTAASELARNTVIYGGGGVLKWALVDEGVRRGVRLTFEDKGPGIANMELALTDGWTSGHGLGLGLTGARRLVNEFEIESAVGVGTRVVITRWK
jgi:serine/threonine-protein kinase RsbT